jgi:hypothetical protein
MQKGKELNDFQGKELNDFSALATIAEGGSYGAPCRRRQKGKELG